MMIYTQYMDAPVDSPYLRNFKAIYGRGDVPAAKFRYQYFDEQPVPDGEMHPLDMADNTTLEKAVYDDRYDPETKLFRFKQFSDDRPHHVHIKINTYTRNAEMLAKFLPYPHLLIQQNLAKLPRARLIATVFLPNNAAEGILHAREIPGYAGAVADLLLADRLQ